MHRRDGLESSCVERQIGEMLGERFGLQRPVLAERSEVVGSASVRSIASLRMAHQEHGRSCRTRPVAHPIEEVPVVPYVSRAPTSSAATHRASSTSLAAASTSPSASVIAQ